MPHETDLPGGAAPGEKTIYITLSADGAISVGMKPAEPAMEEMGGMKPGMGQGMMPEEGMAEEGGESYMQPAASIDEALDMARGMLEGQQQSPEEQVMTGYNSGRRSMPGRMGPAKVFGEE